MATKKGKAETVKNAMNLNEQAEEILRIASEGGVEQNFFFVTTFKRYQVQFNILNNLEKTIKEEGTLCTKEYVKGRANTYTHPAIKEYNNTSNAANQTVQTLMKIIQTMRDESAGDDKGNPLVAFLMAHK